MIQAARIVQEALGPGSGLVLVGGAVRDRLLGRDGGDWDLATSLLPEEVMARGVQAGLRAIPTGIQHGTVTLMALGRGFEITTYRGDGTYLDGRRPESVALGVTLEEDLARRDFTINAMALPLEALEREDWASRIVDPFGGREDLASERIRAVGDPLLRFREDGLRPLRGCRFAAQLDFHLEGATLEAIPLCLDVSAKVAPERVLVELTKLLTGIRADRGLKLLVRTGLLDLWLPELRPMVGCLQNHHHHLPVWEHALEVVQAVSPDPALRWAALLHDAGKPAARTVDGAGLVHFYGHEQGSEALVRTILGRLRSSRALADEVAALVRHHGTHPQPPWSDAACRRFLRRLEQDGLPLARWAALSLSDQLAKRLGAACLPEHQATVARLEALAASRPPLHCKALALDGRTLQALAGRKGGPWLGELQERLLEAVLEDPALNTPGELEALVLAWLRPAPEA